MTTARASKARGILKALAAASTGCLNQALEADFDALMERTKRRVLADRIYALLLTQGTPR
jgi:heme O synthase-like polyprenyltransferase